jgi:hypothetical protein
MDAGVPTNDKLGGGMVSMGRPKASEGWDRPGCMTQKYQKKRKKNQQKKLP